MQDSLRSPRRQQPTDSDLYAAHVSVPSSPYPYPAGTYNDGPYSQPSYLHLGMQGARRQSFGDTTREDDGQRAPALPPPPHMWRSSGTGHAMIHPSESARGGPITFEASQPFPFDSNYEASYSNAPSDLYRDPNQARQRSNSHLHYPPRDDVPYPGMTIGPSVPLNYPVSMPRSKSSDPSTRYHRSNIYGMEDDHRRSEYSEPPPLRGNPNASRPLLPSLPSSTSSARPDDMAQFYPMYHGASPRSSFENLSTGHPPLPPPPRPYPPRILPSAPAHPMFEAEYSPNQWAPPITGTPPVLPILRNQSIFRVQTPMAGWGSGVGNTLASQGVYAPVRHNQEPSTGPHYSYRSSQDISSPPTPPPPVPPPPVPPPPVPPRPDSSYFGQETYSSGPSTYSCYPSTSSGTASRTDLQIPELSDRYSQYSYPDDGETLPSFGDDSAPPGYIRSPLTPIPVLFDPKGKARGSVSEDSESSAASRASSQFYSESRSFRDRSHEASDYELALRLSREGDGDNPGVGLRDRQAWAPFEGVVHAGPSAQAEKRALAERDRELALMLSEQENDAEAAMIHDRVSGEHERLASVEQDHELALMLAEEDRKERQEIEDAELAKRMDTQAASGSGSGELTEDRLAEVKKQEESDAELAKRLAEEPTTDTKTNLDELTEDEEDDLTGAFSHSSSVNADLATSDRGSTAVSRVSSFSRRVTRASDATETESSLSGDLGEDNLQMVTAITASLGIGDEVDRKVGEIRDGTTNNKGSVDEEGWEVYDPRMLHSHILPEHIDSGTVHTQIYVSPPPPEPSATSTPPETVESGSSPVPISHIQISREHSPTSSATSSIDLDEDGLRLRQVNDQGHRPLSRSFFADFDQGASTATQSLGVDQRQRLFTGSHLVTLESSSRPDTPPLVPAQPVDWASHQPLDPETWPKFQSPVEADDDTRVSPSLLAASLPRSSTSSSLSGSPSERQDLSPAYEDGPRSRRLSLTADVSPMADPSSSNPPPSSLQDTAGTSTNTPTALQRRMSLASVLPVFPGVSLGFQISKRGHTFNQLTEFPDVVLLEPDTPLYISAPTFRSLLRVLAHYGSVRVEAPPSLIAAIKAPVQTNAVVQFTKARKEDAEWRCLLHIEVHPTHQQPPDTAPQQPKPRSRIVAQEGPLSTVVGLPTPAPALPISLSTLADYLGQALSDSKAASGSNAKRLHKAVLQSDPDEAAHVTPKAGILSRFMVGARSSRTTDLNENTYDLVTPFVMSDVG